MIRLGANSVLFSGFDFRTASQNIARCGYDGIELSAVKNMCEHLELEKWKTQAAELKRIVADCGIPLLAMEESTPDEARIELACAAAAELGIPVVNVGSGGKAGVEEDFVRQTDLLARMAERAASFGVTLCVKAHVGAAIHDTPTTLRAMQRIASPAFGINMDPSHIHRGGEKPEEALPEVLSRVRHVHIRDCKGPGPRPGSARDQACGRGDINLRGYCAAMVEGGYDGAVSLEIIGAKDLPLEERCIIAAESYGYLNACLRALGAR